MCAERLTTAGDGECLGALCCALPREADGNVGDIEQSGQLRSEVKGIMDGLD